MKKNKLDLDKLEPECPIPQTHRRLLSAHRLWHQALQVYDNPDAFTANLNSVIQELRNVTFIIQSEKSRIASFDEWYEPWRQTLKQDPVARWAVEARNKITKQGDLEKTSLAIASILDRYHEFPIHVFEVSPSTPSKKVAAKMARDAPADIRKHGVLLLERRWAIREFPNSELLELLAKVFGQLNLLMRDAHRLMSIAYEAPGCEKAHSFKEFDPTGIPTCMNIPRHKKETRIKLSTGQFLVRKEKYTRIANKTSDEAFDRYGITDAELQSGDGFFNYARSMNEIARKMLRTDGHHVTVIFLFKQGKPIDISSIAPADTAEKYALFADLADRIEREKVDAILTIGEAWSARVEAGSLQNTVIEELTGKKETLITIAENINGESLCLLNDFSKQDGKIELEPAREGNASTMQSMQAIRMAWARIRKQG